MNEPASDSIGVLLVEDHAVVREGLQLVISQDPGLEVVAQAGALADALTTSSDPDVILADLILTDVSGTMVVESLHKTFPRARILVLSMVDNPSDVRAALTAGASGYMLKDSAARDVVDAIKRVAAGEEYVQPSLGAVLARRTEASPNLAKGERLSKRETEVLHLLAIGHTNSEIARLLGIALRTVEAHRGHIQQKLNVRTRVELVRYAVEAGLFSDPRE